MGCIGDLKYNLLVNKFNSIYNIINDNLSTFTTDLINLQNKINETVASSLDDINNLRNEINNNINNLVPDFANDECYKETIALLQGCHFLSNDSILANPSGFIRSILNDINNSIMNSIYGLVSSILPELDITSGLINYLNKLNSSIYDIFNKIKSLFDITDCLTNFGYEVSSLITSASTLMENLNITFDINGILIFDFDNIFSTAGLLVYSQCMDIYNLVNTIINNCIKNLQNGIQFFNTIMSNERVEFNIYGGPNNIRI